MTDSMFLLPQRTEEPSVQGFFKKVVFFLLQMSFDGE